MTVTQDTIANGLRREFGASLSEIESSTKSLFVETCRVIHARVLSEEEKWILEGEENNFEQHLTFILNIKDMLIKSAALRAISSALRIGYYHAGSAAVISETEANIRNDIVIAENKNHVLQEIKEIIFNEASNKLSKLGYESEFVHTAWTLATAILNKVIRRIGKLDPPDEWRVLDPEKPTKEERKRAHENIRGHIRRNPGLASLLKGSARPIVNG